VTDVLGEVRAHLRAHFTRAGIGGEPDAAGVTFLGAEQAVGVVLWRHPVIP
jgi:hypothetical protein